MFSVDTALPDPIELKFRFRRRIMLLTFFGAITLLGIPVMRERIPAIQTSIASRQLAEQFLSSQLLSTQNKTAVTLKFIEPSTWVRIIQDSADCNSASRTPAQPIFAGNALWKATFDSQDIKNICIHPLLGILVDGKPINNFNIEIIAYPAGQDHKINSSNGIQVSNTAINLISR